MSIKPTLVEFDIGRDIYGRKVRLRSCFTSDNKQCWQIQIDAANQRDDEQRITGLTSENLAVMREAMEFGKNKAVEI